MKSIFEFKPGILLLTKDYVGFVCKENGRKYVQIRPGVQIMCLYCISPCTIGNHKYEICFLYKNKVLVEGLSDSLVENFIIKFEKLT